jgi:hypothetical protein
MGAPGLRESYLLTHWPSGTVGYGLLLCRKNRLNRGYNFYLVILPKFIPEMKKIVVIIIVLAIAAFAIDRLYFSKKAPVTAESKQAALSISKNSATFNTSFEQLLSTYNALKAALTDYDTSKANAAAGAMIMAADSLKTTEITGDSTGVIKQTAADFASSMSGSAKGIMGEADLVKKKRDFNLISDALYNLIRTVRYDRQKFYHQHCPMAFNDEEEAFWISSSNTIENPYLGKKHPKYKASMLHCGDVTDSLDFTKQ